MNALVGRIYRDDSLHRRARERFARYSQIRFHHGDSAEVLPRVIAGLSEPVLFWLPIARELQTIVTHQDRSHVVLIDDAHEFVGASGYPAMNDLRAFVEASRPDVLVEVRDNIIRISPSRGIR